MYTSQIVACCLLHSCMRLLVTRNYSRSWVTLLLVPPYECRATTITRCTFTFTAKLKIVDDKKLLVVPPLRVVHLHLMAAPLKVLDYAPCEGWSAATNPLRACGLCTDYASRVAMY